MWLACRALGVAGWEGNSRRSYDFVSETYGRVQVKARLVSAPPARGELETSVFRSDEFDHAALVLLSAVDYTVLSAVLLPVEVVKQQWGWRAHVRGWSLTMNGLTMQHAAAVDITAEMNSAALGIDVAT